MPNISAFDLTDGTAILTVRPDNASSKNVLFIEDDALKPLNELAKVNYDRPQNGDSIRRTCRINLPFKINQGETTEEVIWLTAKIDFVMDKRSTAAMRTQLRQYAGSLIDAVATTKTVETPEWFW